MDRVWLVLGIFAFFLLCLWGMRRGWRRKSRSQSAQIPFFPSIPTDLGKSLLPAATGVYVSSTWAGQWQNRITTRGAGSRASATWQLYPEGIAVERVGAPSFWIPTDSVLQVRKDKAIAGKVMGTDSLLIVTWQLGEATLDTGFRGDDLAVYPQWIKTLTDLSSKNIVRHKTEDNTTENSVTRGFQP